MSIRQSCDCLNALMRQPQQATSGGLSVQQRGRETVPNGGTQRHSANTNHGFQTCRVDLLTARFRVRIPTPEPISNSKSAVDAGWVSRTSSIQWGSVGAGESSVACRKRDGRPATSRDHCSRLPIARPRPLLPSIAIDIANYPLPRASASSPPLS